jgi:hypothetical protein
MQGRTRQCSGLAIKSVPMESPRSRAADCGRSAFWALTVGRSHEDCSSTRMGVNPSSQGPANDAAKPHSDCLGLRHRLSCWHVPACQRSRAGMDRSRMDVSRTALPCLLRRVASDSLQCWIHRTRFPTARRGRIRWYGSISHRKRTCRL